MKCNWDRRALLSLSEITPAIPIACCTRPRFLSVASRALSRAARDPPPSSSLPHPPRAPRGCVSRGALWFPGIHTLACCCSWTACLVWQPAHRSLSSCLHSAHPPEAFSGCIPGPAVPFCAREGSWTVGEGVLLSGAKFPEGQDWLQCLYLSTSDPRVGRANSFQPWEPYPSIFMVGEAFPIPRENYLAFLCYFWTLYLLHLHY